MEETLRDRLRETIKLSGLAVKELSQKSGVRKGTIDNWVGINPTIPRATDAVAVARALGVTVEYLVTGSDAQDPWLREHADFLRDCKLIEAAGRFGPVERSARAEAEALRDEEKKSGEDSAS